jgi:hypothetical protein
MRRLVYSSIIVGSAVISLACVVAAGAQLTPCPEINSSSSSVGVHDCGWRTKPTPKGHVELEGAYVSYLPVLAVRGNGTVQARNQSAGEQCEFLGACCTAEGTIVMWILYADFMQDVICI